MERDKKAGHVSDKKDKRHGLDRETLFITLFSMFLFPNFFPIAGVFSSKSVLYEMPPLFPYFLLHSLISFPSRLWFWL